MTESVDGNQEFATNDSQTFQTSSSTPPIREDPWQHYVYLTALSIWHSLESLLFYAGIHPSYLVFRLNMAFQAFAGRLSPLFDVVHGKRTKEEDGPSDSDVENSERIAMVPQNRTLPVKRRRAQVSEQSFHGK
jgi:hypothetical protein